MCCENGTWFDDSNPQVWNLLVPFNIMISCLHDGSLCISLMKDLSDIYLLKAILLPHKTAASIKARTATLKTLCTGTKFAVL